MTRDLKTIDAENAELRMRVEALEARLNPPPPKPAIEEGARIHHPSPLRHFVLPPDAELRDLLTIALKASPPEPRNYADEQARENFFRGFKQAFAALGEIGRAAEIDHEHGIVHWLDKARNIGGPGFEFRHFWPAMLAHGDILYQNRDESAGIVPALALASYGGIPAVAAWRDVLARGAPLPPTKPISGNYPPPPVQIMRAGREEPRF
jgi:hypothetical protein